MMEEKKTGSQVPGYRVSLSDFKTLHHLSYSLGLDPPGVSGNQLQVARGKLPSMSLPKAQTPLAPTHWKHLLYVTVLTSSGCKISL